MVNMIWGCFIIIGILSFFIQGDFSLLNETILKSTKNAFDLTIQLFPMMALWLGIMKIASSSGLLQKLSHLLYPLLSKLFPEIPKNDESFSFIASNIIANLFGLGNAATPFGLKAMKSLQTINKKKDTASRSMITFLAINTSGLTMIPTTIISMRLMYGSKHPTEIVFACIFATACSTIAALLLDRYYAKKEEKKCR